MQAQLNKLLKKTPKPATHNHSGMFSTILNLVLQAKSPAQIKAAFPNTLPQVISCYIAACKATIAHDNCYSALAKLKGAK